MARHYGLAPRGQRLRVGVPHGHWKTTTFVAGLRASGLVAPFVLDGPSIATLLRPMSTVFWSPTYGPAMLSSWTTFPATRGQRVRDMIEAAGAALLYLPPYSPDFQSDRERLRQAESPPAQSSRAHR
jgi:hypothetical protein